MSIHKLVTQVLCISLLVFSSHSYAESISLSLNQSSFTVGDLMEISASADGDELTATEADVYLTIQLPDGSLYYWYDFGLKFIGKRNEILSLVTEWPIQTLPTMKLLAFKVPTGLPSGTYKWYLTLAQTGSDVAQPGNWIANVSATFVFSAKAKTSILDIDEGGDDSDEDGERLSSKSEEAAKPSAPPPVPSPPPPSYSPVSPASGGGVTALPSPSEPIITSGTVADIGYSDSADSYDGEAKVDSSIIIAGDIMPWYPDDEQFIPIAGTLTAGDIDDNLNFAAFQRYSHKQTANDSSLPLVDMADRVTIRIVDNAGKGISNARVVASSVQDSRPQINTYTGTDGQFYLFPKFDGITSSQINLQLAPPEDEFGSANSVFNTTLNLEQLPENRSLTITLPNATAALPHSLDIMFVIDTTGSMADELRYLNTELRDIVSTVQSRHPQIRMRFGLVVYRDQYDAYVVRDFAFTDSLNTMQAQLSRQTARGGGDYPEAMEQALETAVNANWSEGNVARLLFLVADAPPHDKNLQKMLEAAQVARQQSLHIYPLAASGVADKAEFMMRNAGVLTQGRYLFLTDDSGVGYSHQEPSVSCYVVTRLNELIARVIDSELAGKRIEPDAKDIVRSVGNYDAGVCKIDDVTPPSAQMAQVENIRVLILESFPVQVQVVAQGYLSDGCEKIKQASSSRDGNTFMVEITTHSVGEFCTEALVPFEEVVSLDVYGIEAGTYTVNVNGITDKFELNIDNMPE